MQIHTFSDPNTFLSSVRTFLEAQESANNLILGITTRLVEHPEWTDQPPFLAVVETASAQVVLVAVMTPPHNLLLSGAPESGVEAFDILIDDMRKGGWSVPGVTAENMLARRFADRWHEITGQPVQIHMRERVYELRQVVPLSLPPGGHIRQAAEADYEIISRWHMAFTEEALGEVNEEQSRKLVQQRLAAGDIFLWEDAGRPVSVAMKARPTTHGYTVSYVYTPPAQRGQGYASACVAALSQILLDSGKAFCNLFTNLSNPTSNDIYQKIGYRPVCDFSEFRFG